MVCMDIRQCRTDTSWVIENQDVFHFEYEDMGDYFLQFDVIDTFGNTETIRQKVQLTSPDDPLGIMSIPAIVVEEGKDTISVGKNLENEVVFYISYSAGSCFMDSDIADDSDQDGDPTNDNDISCNQVAPTLFFPTDKQQVARVYYAREGKKMQKDITINFIDHEVVINEEFLRAYNEIDELLSTFPEEASTDIE